MVEQTLSHYRVLEEIGSGGMGVVYRAYDEVLHRDVALKILSQRIPSDEAARRRFRREALSLAKLNHPNVGMIYDFSGDQEENFLVMEFVPGVALDRHLKAGPLPAEKVIRLGIQLAAALHASHRQGIIHRDLKPGNLRVTPDGQLKILDFGLAQWAPELFSESDTTAFSLGEPMSGTVPYMAPEQLRGHEANIYSDIYAAGVILYEMATGQRPFAECSGPVLVSAILEQTPPSPRHYSPGISASLENVILKAMAKNPGDRYLSAQDLGSALEGAHQRVPIAKDYGLWAKIAYPTVLSVLLAWLLWLIMRPQ
ncbi:MAG: serine/threonine protein kinase [Acidobacteria bacterium]|nr:serine/threonine protein kinase [Acidobacteriota bacterium]